MNQRRILTIIKILSQSDQAVKSSVLCDKLNVTSRTLRSDLKENKDKLRENGIEIQSFPAVGYKLVVFDEKKADEFLQGALHDYQEHQVIVPVYPEDRIHYLIRLFLSSDGYLKADDIADRMFISRSTLSNDLKEVKERLKYFQLEIESIPNYGMRLKGSEFHKRSAISQYFFHTDNIDEKAVMDTAKTKEQSEIASILYRVIEKERFYLTDAGFEGLVIHIMIALMRLKKGKINRTFESDKSLINSREYQIAEEICAQLDETFHCNMPQSERCFIAMHLAGKQAAQYQELYSNYQDLIDETLDLINRDFHVDLTFDMDLRTALSLHLTPMMNRLKYDMIIQNPMLEKIKEDNSTAFEMGVVLAYIVENRYGFKMSDSEIGYVSLHFALALERYKQKGSKKNIIIICASGLGSSQILLYKIRNKFKDYINNIYTTHLYALKDVNQSEYDFILTTVPIPFKTQIPAIHIQYFMDNEDTAKISQALKQTIEQEKNSFVDQYFHDELIFSDLKSSDRDGIIHEMCQKISMYVKLDPVFEKRVYDRENFASTEFGNMIAMPHPMEACNQESFVSLAIFNKPIHWGKGNVRYVFLLSLGQNSDKSYAKLHEALASICFDAKALSLIAQSPTIETIRSIFTSLAEPAEDLDELFG